MRLLEMEMEREKLLQSYTPQDRRVRDIEGRIANLRQRIGEQREWVPGNETTQLHPLRQQPAGEHGGYRNLLGPPEDRSGGGQ